MANPDAFFDGFLDDYYAESDEHLTAAAEGCVWEGLASSEEIEGATFLANVRGNDIP